jgi:hypothetical protein
MSLSVSWPNLTTKIITLWEFLNFVNEVSRLQYEWSSDCWCIWKSLGVNACLQFNEEMYFYFIGEVFLYSFLWIFRVYFWLHMRVSWSISKRRDVATRRNLIDLFKRGISGLIGLAVRAFDLWTEGYIYRFESRWGTFPFIFYFMCNLFSTYYSILTHFFSSIDIFNSKYFYV